MVIPKLIRDAKKSKTIQKIGTGAGICILFVINLIVNAPLRLKAISTLDDLILWNFFNVIRNNPLGYIFSTYAKKYRPVSNAFFLGLFSLFQYRPWMFGVFSVLLSFLIAVILFFILRRVSGSSVVAFLLSVVFLVCRFTYYDIAQVYGIMEATSLLFAIVFLYLVWRFINTKKEIYFWASVGVFFLLIFDHERFVPVVLLYLVIFLTFGLNRKSVLLFAASLFPVIINFAIKGVLFKKLILEGTGGTSIFNTFTVKGFLDYFLSAWLYIAGFNAGPTELNGITARDVPLFVNILIGISILCLLALCMLFLVTVFKDKKERIGKYMQNFTLFFLFIFLNLVVASVTVRVEVRWLTVPYVGLLFLLSYMYSVIPKKRNAQTVFILLLLLWAGVSIPRELFYRKYFKNIYFSGIQTFGNALYEATVKKYGDTFWDYDTYILCAENSSPRMMGCGDYGDLYLYFTQFNQKNVKTRIHFVIQPPKTTNGDKHIILLYDQRGRFREL